ncbi:UNVERIFIED_CONTAM: hypothetical protein FKN15_015270 [Acipenser sinensis]
MAEDARKLRDWILENAGLEAKSMPVAIRILWMMDRERWEAYAREHTLHTWEEGVELVLSYLEAAINKTAAQVAGPPAEGECLLVLHPQPKREEPECPQPKWEEPERPAPEWEEPERPTPEWGESVRPQPKEEGVGACTALGPKLPAEGECLLVLHPQPKREEPECPQPKWEEPERPAPEWEEPERPTPEWGESVRPQPKREELVHPQPKREELVRPQPKREESVRPQPKEEGVGACTALGPKLPAEGECLLVPPPPAEEQCLLSPCPPAEEECLLSPCPPTEGECLLVHLLLPSRELKGEEPSLPSQEPEGEELQAQPPEFFGGGEGQDAGVPQQPLFMLLKAARMNACW